VVTVEWSVAHPLQASGLDVVFDSASENNAATANDAPAARDAVVSDSIGCGIDLWEAVASGASGAAGSACASDSEGGGACGDTGGASGGVSGGQSSAHSTMSVVSPSSTETHVTRGHRTLLWQMVSECDVPESTVLSQILAASPPHECSSSQRADDAVPMVQGGSPCGQNWSKRLPKLEELGRARVRRSMHASDSLSSHERVWFIFTVVFVSFCPSGTTSVPQLWLSYLSMPSGTTCIASGAPSTRQDGTLTCKAVLTLHSCSALIATR
jgi:hypothetical protein